MKNNKGFTLLELMLSISIILLILSIPIFKIDILHNFRERQELSEFLKDINYTKNKAIIESVNYNIKISIKTNSYTIYKVNSNNKKKSIKHKEFKHGTKLIHTAIKNNELSFKSTGAIDGAGTIKLENRKCNVFRIKITPVTGKVNVEYED
jgi:prepilin-type N-terminal cleavage/methylation domain-containing protein